MRARSRILGFVLALAVIVAYNVVTRLQTGRPLPSAAGHIQISDSALQHITDRHTAGGTMNAGKSIFNSGEDIRALIKEAERVAPREEANGRMVRIVDAGRDIGTDRQTGHQTRTYTVITTESGMLITAFPGTP